MDFSFEESSTGGIGSSSAGLALGRSPAPRRVTISPASRSPAPVHSSSGIGPFVLVILAVLFGGVGYGVGTLMNGLFDVVYPMSSTRSDEPTMIRTKAYDFSI